MDIRRKYLSKKVMVFSTKGGTGKSFVAVNLAIDLLNKGKNNVILFDMNYKSGDDTAILNISPIKTTYDIVQKIDKINIDFLQSSLTKHSSGIQILPAPMSSLEAEYIKGEQTMKIIDMLSDISDYIVIDAPAYFSEDVIAVLDKIDYLCIVSTMDILSIKNLKESLYILRKLRFYRDKIILILNRSNSKVGLTIDEVENFIETKIDIAIPSDRLVPLSINKSIPLIIDAPKCSVIQSINKLTQIISRDV